MLLERSGSVSTNQTRSRAASAANNEEVIRFAKQSSGTPYEFSAGPFKQTHTFDCSSFVQHVYAKFHVNLPRSSRAQLLVEQKVTREQLQPGDTMFFSTPGRHKSNRMVGHVGVVCWQWKNYSYIRQAGSHRK
jgi:cell wall-associated NlpC family hydrolase